MFLFLPILFLLVARFLGMLPNVGHRLSQGRTYTSRPARARPSQTELKTRNASFEREGEEKSNKKEKREERKKAHRRERRYEKKKREQRKTEIGRSEASYQFSGKSEGNLKDSELCHPTGTGIRGSDPVDDGK